MRALVAIPWRSRPDRVYAHTVTVSRYRNLLPDAKIVDVDTDHQPFCLAACRNEGVRTAERDGYDVVVLADADTLPERKPLLAAIHGAAHDHLVHLPYTQYRGLGGNGTTQYRAGRPLPACDHLVIPFATSGVYVTTPSTWWACGGQDERFMGWAPEDMAWLISHRALLGADPVRHEGAVYALTHHSPPKDGDAYESAVKLYQRYLEAGDSGNPDAVRALVAENRVSL